MLDVDSMGLVERSTELDVLADLWATVGRGGGRLALVYGEAGIGKTALVRRFCENPGASGRVLWGSCDELFTPRPLGPLFDIALDAGPALAQVLDDGGTPHDVAVALERGLRVDAPTILVLEDMHLADEATLDVLRLLGRRVADLGVLVIVTYRDDAVGRFHPLRLVLGDLGADAAVARLKLSCLSEDSMATIATTYGMTRRELVSKTAGNPFFVTEVLAAGAERMPETVRDAVLGRVSRLGPGARRLLDAISVIRPHPEAWLLTALAPDDIECLDEIIASGVAGEADGVYAFRHELARLAVEESMPAHRREVLHRRALELLAQPPDGAPDPARLAHHAEAVGDGELVARFAPLAAAQASGLGAHREAAAHYRRAVRFADLVPLEARAGLYASAAQESFMIVEFDEAVAEQQAAIECFEQLGDRRALGGGLSFLSQLIWQAGGLPDALAAVERSLAVLEGDAGPELVAAQVQMTLMQLASEDQAAALSWALRAQRLADEIDDDGSRLLARLAVGWAQLSAGDAAGLQTLETVLAVARRAGAHQLAVAACVVIARTACRRHLYEVAERYIGVGLDVSALGDFDVYRYYLVAHRAKLLLARGEWEQAVQVARICLADPCPFARVHALMALGTIRARRGEPGAWEPLDEALALAVPRHELQWIAQVTIWRAEALWLQGRNDELMAETGAALAAGAAGTWWEAGLRHWRWRAGAADEPIPEVGEEQYRLAMAGDWAAASAGWRAIGCPYEAAFALLDADDETTLRAALAEFQRLGAAPAARLATVRLREIGARSVPRGPYAAARENPAHLTRREFEVLELLCEGLRNAEIAERLVVAERTVDHHVSAILRKLGVANRTQAAAEAARLGIRAKR